VKTLNVVLKVTATIATFSFCLSHLFSRVLYRLDVRDVPDCKFYYPARTG